MKVRLLMIHIKGPWLRIHLKNPLVKGSLQVCVRFRPPGSAFVPFRPLKYEGRKILILSPGPKT